MMTHAYRHTHTTHKHTYYIQAAAESGHTSTNWREPWWAGKGVSRKKVVCVWVSVNMRECACVFVEFLQLWQLGWRSGGGVCDWRRCQRSKCLFIFITRKCVLCVDICSCTLCTSVFVFVNIRLHGNLVCKYRAVRSCLIWVQYGALMQCIQNVN